jgi:hypothetical protein
MNKGSTFTVAFAVLLAAGGFAAWKTGALGQFTDQSFNAIPACEDWVKSSLTSPATYKRVSANFVSAAPLSYEEFVAFNENHGCAMAPVGPHGCMILNAFTIGAGVEQMQKGSKAKRQTDAQYEKSRQAFLRHAFLKYQSLPADEQASAYVKIEYDAANLYNATLRGSQICRYGPRNRGRYTIQETFSPGESADLWQQ